MFEEKVGKGFFIIIILSQLQFVFIVVFVYNGFSVHLFVVFFYSFDCSLVVKYNMYVYCHVSVSLSNK